MSKAIQMKNNNENIYPCPYYPVGSIYTSISNVNPSNFFGGTWECFYSDYDYIYLGSNEIYHEWSTSSQVSKTPLIGAYEERMLGIEKQLNQSGYTRKIMLSAQIRTGGGNYGEVFLNSTKMVRACTYSSETFRETSYSDWYSLLQIGRETTYGYSSPGINLYVGNTSAIQCQIRHITIHHALVSNNVIYKWRRKS